MGLFGAVTGTTTSINSLASAARVNDYGFIMTPYRKVVDKKLTDQIDYLTADQEADVMISIATVKVDDDNMIIDETVGIIVDLCDPDAIY